LQVGASGGLRWRIVAQRAAQGAVDGRQSGSGFATLARRLRWPLPWLAVPLRARADDDHHRAWRVELSAI
jgi:hypothetical protein